MFGPGMLTISTMRHILATENIVTAYRSHKRAENAAKWASDNPLLAQVLADAYKSRDNV